MEKMYIIFGLVIVLIVIGFFVVFSFLGKPGADELEKCKTLKFNGDDRVDVVFMSDEKTAEKYINALLEEKPYSENKEAFNFYVIEDYKPDCEIYKEIAILCYSRELIRKAASCPNDYIVVVKEEKPQIRSSAYMNVISLNSNHHPKNVFFA